MTARILAAFLIRLAGPAVLLLSLVACPPPDRNGAPATGDTAPSPAGESWLLAADPVDDLVRAGDTEETLRQRFGDARIARDTIWVGEGFFQIGTIIFPADTARRIAIQWDEEGKPEFVRVSEWAGFAWRLHPGIGVGSTLEDLERLNGGAFDLYGFGWDYAGTIAGWRGGNLSELWGDRVVGRLRRTVEDESLTDQVLGERIYGSDNPAMRALRPVIHEILVRPR